MPHRRCCLIIACFDQVLLFLDCYSQSLSKTRKTNLSSAALSRTKFPNPEESQGHAILLPTLSRLQRLSTQKRLYISSRSQTFCVPVIAAKVGPHKTSCVVITRSTRLTTKPKTYLSWVYFIYVILLATLGNRVYT